jgi:hypothetical protein
MSGREPIEIVEIDIDYCDLSFGILAPSGFGTPILSPSSGDTVLSTELNRTASIVGDFDVIFAASPVGIIWEQGGTGNGAYLGVTGTELVFRAGDGASGGATGTAMIRTPVAPFAGKTLRVIAEIVMPATVRLTVLEGQVLRACKDRPRRPVAGFHRRFGRAPMRALSGGSKAQRLSVKVRRIGMAL